MPVRFYAEAMYRSERWQVICETKITGHCSVVGNNLSQHSARQLAEDFQRAAVGLSKVVPESDQILNGKDPV